MTVVCRYLAVSLALLLSQKPLVVAQSIQSDTPLMAESKAFLRAEPQTEIQADGKVIVILETRENCTGGEAFLGIFPRQAELPYPVYRRTGNVELLDSHQVQVKFDLKDLESEGIDINDLKGQGGGQVALRLQLFGKKLNIIDRVFAYQRSTDNSYQRIPALIEGLFVDCVTDTSAIISGAFDLPCHATLKLTPEASVPDLGTDQRRFEVALTQLRPSTEYTYSLQWLVGKTTLSTSSYTFRTASTRKSIQSFRFAVLSDGRAASGGGLSNVEGVNQQILTPLLNQIYRLQASFILFPGDLVTGSAGDRAEIEAQFRSFKRVTQPIAGHIPLYEGAGNHDMPYLWVGKKQEDNFISTTGPDAGEVIFAEQFVNPTNSPAALPGYPPYLENVYSFDWGNAHFAMLNNNYFGKGSDQEVAHLAGDIEGTLRPEQLNWLDQDLTHARQRGQTHLFVFAHEPAFPCGGHTEDGMWWKGQNPAMLAIRNQFWQILCQHEVRAAFFGHEHNYSRTSIDQKVDSTFSFPIWQIITGGAGAPFYNQDHTVPWAKSVVAFYPLAHFCLVEVSAEKICLKVITPEGFMVDEVDLTKP